MLVLDLGVTKIAGSYDQKLMSMILLTAIDKASEIMTDIKTKHTGALVVEESRLKCGIYQKGAPSLKERWLKM